MKGNQFVHKILPASMEKPNQKEIGLANLASTNGSCYCKMSQSPESKELIIFWSCVYSRIQSLLCSCWALHITILPPSTSLSQIHTHLCRWQAWHSLHWQIILSPPLQCFYPPPTHTAFCICIPPSLSLSHPHTDTLSRDK